MSIKRFLSGTPRHRTTITAGTLAAIGLLGSAAVVVGTPSMASATVTNTTSQWGQPGGAAIYTIQNLAEPGNKLLEDHGNEMNNGAVTDVWDEVNQATGQDPMATQNGNSYGSITQANELWEFVPQASNTGDSLFTGYGELINRQSGLCLDVNGSNPNEYGDGATVDQWTCVPGAQNEQWTSTFEIQLGAFALQPASDGGGGWLGVGNSTCAPQGDGDLVYVRTTGQTSGGCDAWNIGLASYDYATDEVSMSFGATSHDTTTYGCLPGYNLRLNQSEWLDDEDWFIFDYDNISDPGVNVTSDTEVYDTIIDAPTDEMDLGAVFMANPTQLLGYNQSASEYATWVSGWGYTYATSDAGHEYADGQMLLYCDPDTGVGAQYLNLPATF